MTHCFYIGRCLLSIATLNRQTMRPSKMMQQIVQFYQQKYPRRFRQQPPKDVLEVHLVASTSSAFWQACSCPPHRLV